MIYVKCTCGRKLKVPSKLEGTNVNCPVCGVSFTAKQIEHVAANAPSFTSQLDSPIVPPPRSTGDSFVSPSPQLQTDRQSFVRRISNWLLTPPCPRCHKPTKNADRDPVTGLCPDCKSMEPRQGPSNIFNTGNGHSPPLDVQVDQSTGIAPVPSACPYCGDVHIQKVSVIYESGTHQIDSTFVGLDANLDVMGGVGKSVSRSSLALRLAPPTPPIKKNLGIIPAVLIIAVVTFIAGCVGEGKMDSRNNNLAGPYASVGFLIGMIAAGGLAFAISTAAEGQHQAATGRYNATLTDWKRSFFCHRCGQTFVPQRANPA